MAILLTAKNARQGARNTEVIELWDGGRYVCTVDARDALLVVKGVRLAAQREELERRSRQLMRECIEYIRDGKTASAEAAVRRIVQNIEGY